jgi:hypothetical protein
VSGLGGLAWSYAGHCLLLLVYSAYCVSGGGSASAPPCFAVERGRGCSTEGLPLLVREAAHHGRGVLAVGEEARRPARVASRYILSRRPSCRLEHPAFPGKLAV